MNQYELFDRITKIVIITTKEESTLLYISHESNLPVDEIIELALKQFKINNNNLEYNIKEVIIKNTEPAIQTNNNL